MDEEIRGSFGHFASHFCLIQGNKFLADWLCFPNELIDSDEKRQGILSLLGKQVVLEGEWLGPEKFMVHKISKEVN